VTHRQTDGDTESTTKNNRLLARRVDQQVELCIMAVCCMTCVVLCLMQVTGVIQDSAGHVRYVLSGTWDDKLEGAPVLNTIESSKGKVMYETGETRVLWQRRYPP